MRVEELASQEAVVHLVVLKLSSLWPSLSPFMLGQEVLAQPGQAGQGCDAGELIVICSLG